MSSWYDPYWDRLKTKDRLELVSDHSEHTHVLKAIRKLAAKDTGFSYLCTENNKSYKIRTIREPKKLIVYLDWSNHG